MESSLDQLFDYLERVEDSVQEIDRESNTVYVKARNGRTVALRLTSASASQLAGRTDLEFMGGSNVAERSFALFTIHLDEAINSFANQERLRFVLDDTGYPVPVE